MDFYVILGLERGATLNDVKREFRRLARKYHPDINPGDRVAAAHFEQISQAYDTLIDPERRRHYDTAGVERPVPEVAFGFEGFDFSVSVSGATHTHDLVYRGPYRPRTIKDFIKTGDNVRVRYRPIDDALLAVELLVTTKRTTR